MMDMTLATPSGSLANPEVTDRIKRISAEQGCACGRGTMEQNSSLRTSALPPSKADEVKGNCRTVTHRPNRPGHIYCPD